MDDLPTLGEQRKRLWTKTTVPNLIRYVPKGTFFLRAKINGFVVRESLKTTRFDIAKTKLHTRLMELRARAGKRTADGIVSLADALELIRAQIDADPSLKENTRRSYREELNSLRADGAAPVPLTPLPRLREADLAKWWQNAAGHYSPQRANHLLMFVRRAVRLAIKLSVIGRDPTEELTAVPLRRKRLPLVTAADLQSIAASIRAQGKRASEESANYVEFMAYSGMRPGEIEPLTWEDLDAVPNFIIVRGGVEGTKNYKSRRVPKNPAMIDLLERMRGGKAAMGKVFGIVNPRYALANACRRLGLPHLRIYDLRHMFATICNTSGVDVSTFADWLGHSDGGALAMKTYVHPHEEHSLKSAAKVTFK